MAKLNDKHLQCLHLLKQNKHSVADIAKAVGFTKEHLYHLISGDIKHGGKAADVFQAEYNRINKVVEARTSRKVSQVREKVIDKLQSWVEAQKTPDKFSKLTHKQMVDTLNSLSKAVPQINIESYSWTTLRGDELLNEFNRITALAKSLLGRKGVPGPPKGGTGQVPPSDRQTDYPGTSL